ncbi:hypothetical protein EDD17DRAFT_1511164 [Pisolithus thermaeus]|nr:hypothetical protein EDD17DRAFT_1511164 [Pisolithus thermaeus]
MEASTSVDQSQTLQLVNIPIPPGGGSIDQMAAMCNVMIPTPPGSVTAPSMDRMEAMHSATIPTPPASAPEPCMDQMVAMCNATIPTLPAGMPTPQIDRMAAMKSGDQMVAMCNATIPTPPACMPSPQSDRMVAMRSGDRMVAMCNATIPTLPACMPSPQTASPPQPPLLNNLERMKIVVILIPPSAATVLLARIEMTDEQLQPPALTGGNVDHPHQSTSIEVVDGQTQPSTITEGNISQGEEPDCSPTVDFGNQDCLCYCIFHYGHADNGHLVGDAPTPDEHQALEQAGLATSDSDDDFLHTLQTFKSQHGADFPPAHFPYNKQLDGHIISWVQNMQAGQYMVDMIDLLEVSCHPHVGYSLQPYTRGPPYPSQQSMIEMAIVYLGCCIECVVIHLLGWYANLCLDMVMISGAEGAGTPHPGNHIMGKLQSHFASMLSCIFTVPKGPDGSLQYIADFEQMRGARIFPIAHEYFQWLSMGDQIDEWMEEKVSAYMIAVRGVVCELEKNEQDIDHLFLQWFALSRLLGLRDA